MSHHCGRYEKFTDRRDFLKKAGAGFGLLALADLLQGNAVFAGDGGAARGLDPMAPRQPHYPAKARAVIWLFMEGAPSSVDLFDPKPELTKRDGQRIDINVFNGMWIAPSTRPASHSFCSRQSTSWMSARWS